MGLDHRLHDRVVDHFVVSLIHRLHDRVVDHIVAGLVHRLHDGVVDDLGMGLIHRTANRVGNLLGMCLIHRPADGVRTSSRLALVNRSTYDRIHLAIPGFALVAYAVDLTVFNDRLHLFACALAGYLLHNRPTHSFGHSVACWHFAAIDNTAFTILVADSAAIRRAGYPPGHGSQQGYQDRY